MSFSSLALIVCSGGGSLDALLVPDGPASGVVVAGATGKEVASEGADTAGTLD